jgi:SAM-dependent methyltransferase
MDFAGLVRDKSGIEIGGPSGLFNHSGIYAAIGSLNNVIFSADTVWANFTDKVFSYYPGKEGKVFEMDAVNLSLIPDDSYDVLLSSHNLEHIANPLKALKEWVRIVKLGGYIILVLPEKSVCFDHRRQYTSFETIYDKYHRNVGEDNLESLPEILRLHDLSLDTPAGNFEQFTRRSLDNFKNRCLHHHVFNRELVKAMAHFVGIKLIHHHIEGLNMWFVLQC